jgi:hypothetical protein
VLPGGVNADERIKSTVQDALGANPNTPPLLLRELAEMGQLSVARNPAATPEDLRLLYLSSKWAHAELASNPATPQDLLEQLARSRSGEIQERLASNPACSSEVLARLAQPKNKACHAKLAANPSASAELLLQIARQAKSHDTWLNLLSNPATPEEALLAIGTSPAAKDLFAFEDADRKMLKHPNLSGQVVDALITRGRLNLADLGAQAAKFSGLSVASMERLFKVRGGTAIRRQLASNPSAPAELLQRLVGDKDESVRLAATRALSLRARESPAGRSEPNAD